MEYEAPASKRQCTVAGLPVCSLLTVKQVYDHKTGERLSPHLVKAGRQTEHEAMTRHQLFERVPIAMARGKKVICQWLDEMKEGANRPFVRSRLVAMEVAHGVRLDTFASTAPLKCIKIIISRAASIKNTRGGHSRVLALYDISVAFWHALLPEDKPIAMYPPRGEEEAGYMWQMKRAMLLDETSIASLPGTHEEFSKPTQCRRLLGLIATANGGSVVEARMNGNEETLGKFSAQMMIVIVIALVTWVLMDALRQKRLS